MFQALKRHILRERQKKKQEQEADAEVERQRKERELQQKQDVMTLEENREQIANLEQTLASLKDEKHQLFLQLKKVLNEDDNRRRQLVRHQQETTSSSGSANEVVDLYGMYPPGVGGHMGGPISHLVMPSNYPPMANRSEALYKMPPIRTPSMLKKPPSPSPPPQQVYHQNYSQKSAPALPPRITYQKGGNYNYYHHNSTPSSVPQQQQPQGYTYQVPSYVPSPNRNEVPQDSQTSKHTMYLSQPLPRGSINQAYMHSPLDHPKIGYNDDNYYPVASIRPATHVPLHGGAIPIQQPAQGTKTGGITSGYPIRPPSSAPPPHVAPPVSNTTLGMYSNQAASSSRLVYSQAGVPQTRFIQQRR